MARLLLFVGCLTTLFVCADTADAQRRIPARATRPVISPYANLFRGDNAGLNSYFTAVRPRQAAQQFIQDTSFEFAVQQQMIDQRSMQLQQELEASMGATSTLQQRPTSASQAAMRRPAGGFMNFSSFYSRGMVQPQVRTYR